MSCQQQSETSGSVGTITSVTADSRSTHTDLIYTHKQKASFIGSEISSLQGLITVDTFSVIPEYFYNTVSGLITINGINYVESLVESYGIETTISPYDSFRAGSEEEMLALTIKLGDRCYRTDLSISYINISGINDSLNDWDIFGGSSEGGGLSETVVQAMITSAVQPSNTHRAIITGNPHHVTKTDVGLSNVPNTDFTSAVTNSVNHITIVTGNPHQVTKAEVGLGNVPNTNFTTDIAASNAHIATITGNPHRVTKTDVGLSNVPNVDFTNEIAANTSARHTHSNKAALDLVVGENTGDQEDIIGNAGTATKLASPVLINNIPFDGSDDITIPTGDVTLTGIQTLTNKTLESVTLNKGITEQGYTMPDNIIRANNGSILTKALSANTIFTDALLNGQSITLTVTNGASYTVTWPTIVWVSSIGNVAPLMHPNNVFVIWKNGSVLYGTVVGYF